MKTKVKKFWQNNKLFILFIILMIGFRSAIADWNTVPTGSMEPTIIPGDRVWVNKLAYDFKIPFTKISLYQFSNPKRGDIIIFNSEKANKRLIKRVMGLPGDVIEMRDNRLYINGVAAQYSPIMTSTPEQTPRYTTYALYLNETIESVKHATKFYPDQISPLKNLPLIKIPQDHYFVLGDNRDNSMDSRYYGFIPRDEIIGRSKHIVMSLNYDNYYLPRSNRFFIYNAITVTASSLDQSAIKFPNSCVRASKQAVP